MIRKLLKVEFREAFSSMLPVGAGMLVLSALTALNSAVTARIRVSSAGFDWLGALLAFAMSMDDVVISFFVTGTTSNTLPLQVYSMLKMGVTPEVNALCTLMLLVVFGAIGVFYLLSSLRRKAR